MIPYKYHNIYFITAKFIVEGSTVNYLSSSYIKDISGYGIIVV
jgi:hypothetical protein